MATEEDRRLGKLAVELGFTSKQQVNESLRILRLRSDIQQSITLDHLLFERKLLDAGEIYEIQARSGLRPVFCPACPARLNTFLKKPGSITSCPRCGHRIPVAGFDPADPFKVRSVTQRLQAPPSRTEIGLGLIGVAGVGTLIGKSVQESWASHMWLYALGVAGCFLAITALLGRRGRFLAASSAGLAMFTGLVVGSVLGNPPGEPALSVFGLGAHQVVPLLILFHLVVMILAASSTLVKRGSKLPLLALLMLGLYGLAFFTWRSVPGTDPTHYLSGGPALLPDRLPWFLHPGVVTLLVLFPLGAVAFLFSSAYKLRLNRLVRHAGLAIGLALLTGFGLAVGTARGEIPSARLEVEVQQALAGRLAPFWTAQQPALKMGTTAAAATAATKAR